MLERGFDDVARKLARFADAQASDGISGEADVHGSAGGFAAQVRVHAALDDAKQGLRRARVGTGLCPVQAWRSPASTRSSWGIARPRHLVFVCFEIILAALGPAP